MDVNSLLATVVLVSFVVTIVLAVGSYIAYKVREGRRPRAARAVSDEPVFFERFFPPIRATAVAEPAKDEAGGGGAGERAA